LSGKCLFGWSARQVQQMTTEEYCARGLGVFCDAARRALDANCLVLDYSAMTPECLAGVARRVGFDVPDRSSAAWANLMGVYAKDASGQRRYEDDSIDKRRRASDVVRHAGQRWAEEPYRALLGCSALHGSLPTQEFAQTVH
jgi:hypothetical protein